MIVERLLTVEDAIALLRLPSRDAFYKWRRRHHVQSRAKGRRLLFRKSDLLLDDSSEQAEVIDFFELGRQHARGGR